MKTPNELTYKELAESYVFPNMLTSQEKERLIGSS